MSPRTTLPAGRSIHRGYASAGLGDGPGQPISRGEQFLAADEPFAGDAGLLAALRPWMTLDFDAGDHRRLGERLEAWSSFTHAGWVVVVRLVPAGTFDHRAAYVSHARAFPADAVGGAADPGALVGRSEAFDSPGPDGRSAAGVAVPAPEMVRPEQIAAEPETAADLLAHLLQALLDQRPLVVAVPVEELAAGAPLHALVSFARAALPPRLKRDYRMRIYARSPELFLGRLDAHLLVVPESVASDALAVRRDAVLLDRRARRHAGSEPEPGVRAWAHKLVLWACERPRALLEFAARYGECVWDGSGGPLGEREVVSVAVTYRLAEELAADGEPSRNLLGQLRNAAAKMETGTVPWERLLGPEEWRRFARREVLELVLADREGLPAGARELQDTATGAARELGWSATEVPTGGGGAGHGGFLRRLLDLFIEAPGLVPAETLRCRLSAADLDGRRLHEWLRDVGTEALLRLASVVAPEDGPLEAALAWTLLVRMRREPSETGALLVRRGAWSWWRRRAPSDPAEVRDWALAWLGSPVWEEAPRVDPRLEDWDLALADLGERFEGREVTALLGDGRRAWPWIRLFADRQVEDLARLMPDLGTLSTFVERCARRGPLDRADVEVRALAAFADGRPALGSLDPAALRWLSECPEPPTLPELSAAGHRMLYREAGSRRSWLVENLVRWLEWRGLSSPHEEELLRWLDGLGTRRRSPTSERARALARALAERGHDGTARFLDPEHETRLEETAGARRLLDALAAGRLEDPSWIELRRRVLAHLRDGRRPAARHPLRELAASVSDVQATDGSPAGGMRPAAGGLMDRLPRPFWEADSEGEEPLPIFELAAVLFEELPAGALAVRLAFSAPPEQAACDGWWRSLLRGVDGCRRRGGRRSALDRPDVARALLARMRPDLTKAAGAALGRILWPELARGAAASAGGGVPSGDDLGGGP